MGQFDHVVVVGYGRSAVAKSGKKGALRNMHPVTMGGLTLKGVLEKVPQLPVDRSTTSSLAAPSRSASRASTWPGWWPPVRACRIASAA